MILDKGPRERTPTFQKDLCLVCQSEHFPKSCWDLQIIGPLCLFWFAEVFTIELTDPCLQFLPFMCVLCFLYLWTAALPMDNFSPKTLESFTRVLEITNLVVCLFLNFF